MSAARHRSAVRWIERQTLALGLLVLAAMAFLSYVSIIAINGIPFSHPYKLRAILASGDTIVKRGDEVDVAGQRVGEVRGVVLTPLGRMIEMDIDSGRVGRDATAVVRLRGLAGATYIELHRGTVARPAPPNWTIPASRTSSNMELTSVIAAFDAQARGALSRDLYAYGSGIAGRGTDLGMTLTNLPPLLREGGPLLRAFSPSPGALSGFVHELDGTLRGFAGEAPGDLESLISGGATTFEALALEQGPIGATLDELRPFSDSVRASLPIADPVLRDATTTLRTLEPGVRALAVALPNLDRLLRLRSALRQLSVLAHTANPVISMLGPVLWNLYDGAASLAPFAAAIEPLAAYVSRYPAELYAGPHGFTTWGGFHYDALQARGARAIRFAPVLTPPCGRDPYPAPGQVGKDRLRCR